MKRNRFLLILISIMNLSCANIYGQKKKSVKTFEVSGIVTQAFSYCGGAAPPAELLEKLATPVAYPGKKFYIRKGKINNEKARIITSFSTDKDGRFSINLPPGTYVIILPEQLNRIRPGDFAKQDLEVDEQCLQNWWLKPYQLLEIKNKPIRGLSFLFNHRCFIDYDLPCINYIGPSPS